MTCRSTRVLDTGPRTFEPVTTTSATGGLSAVLSLAAAGWGSAIADTICNSEPAASIPPFHVLDRDRTTPDSTRGLLSSVASRSLRRYDRAWIIPPARLQSQRSIRAAQEILKEQMKAQ